MISLDKVLEIAIAGAPAAAFILLVVWAIWFVRRLLHRIARFFRKEPQPDQAQPSVAGRPVRIEPVLEPTAFTQGTDAADSTIVRELKENVAALTRRVAALEERLALQPAPRDPGHILRVVKNDEGTPA
jgi:hypothetical protein